MLKWIKLNHKMSVHEDGGLNKKISFDSRCFYLLDFCFDYVIVGTVEATA